MVVWVLCFLYFSLFSLKKSAFYLFSVCCQWAWIIALKLALVSRIVIYLNNIPKSAFLLFRLLSRISHTHTHISFGCMDSATLNRPIIWRWFILFFLYIMERNEKKTSEKFIRMCATKFICTVEFFCVSFSAQDKYNGYANASM